MLVQPSVNEGKLVQPRLRVSVSEEKLVYTAKCEREEASTAKCE